MLDRMIFRVATHIDAGANSPDAQRLWGDKESATSTIVKLSQVQIRWVELELDVLKLCRASVSTTSETPRPLNDEEMEIFHHALHRWEEARPLPLPIGEESNAS